jgi:transposase
MVRSCGRCVSMPIATKGSRNHVCDRTEDLLSTSSSQHLSKNLGWRRSGGAAACSTARPNSTAQQHGPTARPNSTAQQQRITAWQRCHVSLSRYQQEAELKAIRAEFPDYAAIHRHVLQDVLARLDKTYQAFFLRLQRGDKAGFPRFKGRDRFHSFTFKEYGNGAQLDNGCLVLSKIGRVAVRWSRPLEGTPKTVTLAKAADGWYGAIFCAAVLCHPLPLTGQATGIALGLQSCATLADGG